VSELDNSLYGLSVFITRIWVLVWLPERFESLCNSQGLDGGEGGTVHTRRVTAFASSISNPHADEPRPGSALMADDLASGNKMPLLTPGVYHYDVSPHGVCRPRRHALAVLCLGARELRRRFSCIYRECSRINLRGVYTVDAYLYDALIKVRGTLITNAITLVVLLVLPRQPDQVRVVSLVNGLEGRGRWEYEQHN